MRGGPTFDKERVSLNIARLRKGGDTFEIVIDPDKAVKYKEGDESLTLRDVLRAQKIFSDAKKGVFASEERLQSLFNTTDPLSIAEIIFSQGEVQLTHEYREGLREKKKNRIVSIIHMTAINPSTQTVHPQERIRRALEEAKFRINEFASAESQVSEAVRAIRPIIPIKIATYIAQVQLSALHASKQYGLFGQYGTVVSEQWLSDGSLAVKLEIPAGRYNDFVDILASKTQGEFDITKEEK